MLPDTCRCKLRAIIAFMARLCMMQGFRGKQGKVTKKLRNSQAKPAEILCLRTFLPLSDIFYLHGNAPEDIPQGHFPLYFVMVFIIWLEES